MRKNRISEFLESIDSEKWNCVYQTNGMTLLTSKEYNYRYEEIVNLKIQLKKQKEVIDKINHYIEKQTRMYGLSMPIELGTHLDNILGILKEVSE